MANSLARLEQSQIDTLAFDAGRKRAANWFVECGYSLCVYRDQRRADFLQEAAVSEAHVCASFDAGFASGLADFIAGVKHV